MIKPVHLYIRLDYNCSFYKTLSERKLIDYNNLLHIGLNEVPRIGESFILPYGCFFDKKQNDSLSNWLSKRPNNFPMLKVLDLAMSTHVAETTFYYLKCQYIKDTHNWVYNLKF